ncbi:GNAT family N-acetyltransferase [Polycladidibacter stylochi]|uniref:GNAT family N-acetyltransferase n=1 Tax=Polycladidibacter stylochi TaxID=1807766 RepID=UPI0008369518|nr:GNAT family N-acetyltransferase [Pseudovibrio stylochi]
MQTILNVRLETSRLQLRPAEERDIACFHQYLSDYAVSSMLAGVPHPYTLEDARNGYFASLEERKNGDVLRWVIDNGSGMIGSIGARKLQSPNALLGYWLGPPFQGLGYMREALARVLAYLFNERGMANASAHVFEGNERSANVLLQAGFSFTATCTSHSLARSDENVPDRIFTLTRDTYKSALLQ